MLMMHGAADREISQGAPAEDDLTVKLARDTLARLAAKQVQPEQRTEAACHFLAGIEAAYASTAPWDVETVETLHGHVFKCGATVLEEIAALGARA